MSDFWSQLLEYTNTSEKDAPDNPEHLLSKILAHVEEERRVLEAQVTEKMLRI